MPPITAIDLSSLVAHALVGVGCGFALAMLWMLASEEESPFVSDDRWENFS